MDSILVVNAGSSSVKFQVFGREGGGALSRLIKGQMDGIGVRPRLKATANGKPVIDRTYEASDVSDVPAAMGVAGAWLRDAMNLSPLAVGHRVVHGGPDFDRPTLIDDDVLRKLARYEPLAPLHQPNNLAPIRSLRARFPDLPQVACFDTAFHRAHGENADRYAIPERYYKAGVRRYGFHGLSYEFIAGRLQEIAPEAAKGRVIVAHLGSGASMCALRDGRSVESTMGFTALDGLPMGTRPGQIDPGVILYLMMQENMPAAAIQDMLYKECGLKGLSGISNDVRELEGNDDPRARFALDHFAYRIALNAGMLAAALGGVDTFVFTAGIGENSSAVRALVMDRLQWLGARLDGEANAAGKPVISTPDSPVGVRVISTDEELMIARHTVRLLDEKRPPTV
jgi:acetate kinase